MGFLPTTIKEIRALGWDAPDVILVTGDAYVDHPSFGAAVIGRLLEAEGLRVAVVPQPNWLDDGRDFRKLGEPKLFFGVTSGSMDSMVNHYTAARRLRSDDAYTAGGAAGRRPDRAATVYTRRLKEFFPHVPVVLGGIEASLRRFTHYDYWDDALRPSILVDSGADIVAWGMGDESIIEIARALKRGFNMKRLRGLRQVAFLAGPEYIRGLEAEAGAGGVEGVEGVGGGGETGAGAGGVAGEGGKGVRTGAGGERGAGKVLRLHSFEECVADPKKFAANFVNIETESNLLHPVRTLVEPVGEKYVVVKPPYPLMSSDTLDRSFELPYQRAPHPRYNGRGEIPAWEMIKNSINIHRGCFGGCSFCTISAHQGKFITSRSESSVVREVERVAATPGFKGHLSDLGGPSANMYGMAGRDAARCGACRRASCLTPRRCGNLDNSHLRLLALYGKVRGVKGIKKVFVGSGIRYDLFEEGVGGLNGRDGGSRDLNGRIGGGDYLREVILHHTSGRLKVAPEHTEPHVLKLMRKPPWENFERMYRDFRLICDREGLRTQLIPYFISSHPGCTGEDMRRLAAKTRRLGLHTDQVQDLTPTPMTLSSVMFHTGLDPYTGEKLFVAKDPEAKKRQKSWFFRKP